MKWRFKFNRRLVGILGGGLVAILGVWLYVWSNVGRVPELLRSMDRSRPIGELLMAQEELQTLSQREIGEVVRGLSAPQGSLEEALEQLEKEYYELTDSSPQRALRAIHFLGPRAAPYAEEIAEKAIRQSSVHGFPLYHLSALAEIGEAAAPHMHKLIVNGDARFSIDVVTSLAMGNSSQATKETVTELLLATPKESRGVGWKGAIQFIGTLSDRPEVTIPALLKLAREDKSVATECITAITRQPFGVSVRPIRRAFPEVMPILMQMEPAKRDPLFVGLVNVLPQADIYGLVRRFGVLKVEDLVKVFEDEKMRRELVEYMLEDKNF